jgi:Ca2+-transporting ATPase
VEEGRVIYGNLRRVVYFLLATNLGEILTLIAALLLGLDLPLTAVMLLWINLVTDGACTVPLGIEPRHRDVLKQPPRDPRAPILDRPLMRRMLLLTPLMAAGTLGLFWRYRPAGLDVARTVAFTTLVVFQWFQAFSARSRHQSVFSIGLLTNKGLLLGVGAAALLQVAVIYTPVGRLLFGVTSLAWSHWLWIFLVSSSVWVADEVLKLLGVHGRPSKGVSTAVAAGQYGSSRAGGGSSRRSVRQ